MQQIAWQICTDGSKKLKWILKSKLEDRGLDVSGSGKGIQ
jgi:hypothetical protein